MAEALERQDFELEEVEADSVKCTGCGSNMVFHPESKTLKCPHCGLQKSFGDSARSEEIDLTKGFSCGSLTDNGSVVFACDGCGAKVVLSEGETAKKCPFCGTAHVRKLDDLDGVKPNAVIPFGFGEEKALSLSKEWAKKRLFAPGAFKQNVNSDNVKGVYTPSFTFDSKTSSYYEGKIGQTRTRTVGSGKNKRVETYVVWRYIRGTFDYAFDDVLISAGSKVGQAEINKISPFDTNESINYQEKCLLGFVAYHYDRELESCWTEAKSIIDENLKSLILNQYVHDRVAYFNISTSHQNVTFKYVLLPVYVGNYTFKKKVYNFFVNGCTGKVYGKTPKSPLKIAIAVALALLAVVGLVMLFNG